MTLGVPARSAEHLTRWHINCRNAATNPGDNPNIYIATGDSGNGMTHGTIAGILLTDMIVGRTNPWQSLYDPERVSIKGEEAGGIHKRSAKCTHLKCIVHWNSLEKSRDRPCHGSRFTPYGDVLNGPALTGLEGA